MTSHRRRHQRARHWSRAYRWQVVWRNISYRWQQAIIEDLYRESPIITVLNRSKR